MEAFEKTPPPSEPKMRFGRVNIGLSELYGTGRIPFQLSGTARRPRGYAGLSAHSAPGRLLRRHGGAHRQAGYAPASARPHLFCPPRQPPDGKMRRGSRHGPQTVRRSFWRRQAVGTGMTAENGRGRICLEDRRHPFVFRCGRSFSDAAGRQCFPVRTACPGSRPQNAAWPETAHCAKNRHT